jgi:serine/threonine-protein kinase RsbW
MTEDVVFAEVNAVTAEIRHLSAWLEEQSNSLGVPPGDCGRLDLCLNEAVANAITHGGATEPIRVEFRVTQQAENGSAVLSIFDNGKEFDISKAPLRKRPTDLAEAIPGGLGLIMIRNNADVLHWSRVNGKNRLDLTVQWAKTPHGN